MAFIGLRISRCSVVALVADYSSSSETDANYMDYVCVS